MAIYVIGDLHLSEGVDKPMNIFEGWENYTQRIWDNWNRVVSAEDTVVLAGDISWGMGMAEAIPDFLWIDKLPGRKLILKGNHDYWWASVTSMHRALSEHGITSIDFLHNNSFVVEEKALCGSRGWLFENGAPHDAKIVRRETLRLEASLHSVTEEVEEKIVFLHYPPLYTGQILEPLIEVMEQQGVKRCYYGHIHGKGHRQAITGLYHGIDFRMISADYIDFTPEQV